MTLRSVVRSIARATLVAVGLAVGVASAPAAADDLRVVPLAPASGANVADDRPAIDFEVHSSDGVTIPRGSVHVAIDGRSVDRDVQIVGAHLEIVPSAALAQGRHVVVVRVDGGSPVRWSFVVDRTGSIPTVRDGTSSAAVAPVDDGSTSSAPYGDVTTTYAGNDVAPNPPYDNSFAPVVYPRFTTVGDYYGGGYYGSGYGSFYPLGAGPYYWGDSIRYVYTGALGGGFVTLGGFPGSYPLVAFAPNYYSVTVPVPYGYGGGGAPVAYCHCGARSHARLLRTAPVRVAALRRPSGASAPAYARASWRPSIEAVGARGSLDVPVRASAGRFAAPIGSAATSRTPSFSRSIGVSPIRTGSGFAPARTFAPATRRGTPIYRTFGTTSSSAPMLRTPMTGAPRAFSSPIVRGSVPAAMHVSAPGSVGRSR